MKFCVSAAAFLLVVTLLTPSASQAATVTVSLIVDPSSVVSDYWSAGDLVEVTVQATSDGEPNQGFSGGDFGSGSFAITVDGTCLKIHDVKFSGAQVDMEYWAGIFNGLGTPPYSKAADTWAYDEFTDFLKPDPNDSRDIILTDTSMRAIPSAVLGEYNLGRGTPADFLHIVLEVQAGFDPGETSAVTFYGQVGAYDVDQDDIVSDLFGTVGGDVNTGSFLVTNLPEPASLALLCVGGLALAARRRSRL